MLANKLILSGLNRILSQNESISLTLIKYSGKTFKINCLGLAFAATIDDKGTFTNPQPNYDAEIIIPASIVSWILQQDQLGAVKQININGDSKLGLDLIKILSDLDFSVDVTTKNPSVNLVIAKLIKALTKLKHYIQSVTKSNLTSLTEYLFYEKQIFVNSTEHNQFCNQVDELKLRTENLARQISTLKQLV